jgi:tetratricopeptide (TPR) repeat protein
MRRRKAREIAATVNHTIRLRAVAGVLLLVALTSCGGANGRYTAHLERGQKYLLQGNLDKAGIEFRNALQIRPKSAEALYLSGKLAEQRGNFRAAFGFYQAAFEETPDHVQARTSLARLYVLTGSPEKALELVEPWLAKHPDDPESLTARAAARFALKDIAAARTDAEHAVRVAPTNEHAIGLLAGIYRQSGDYPRAITLVSEAVRQLPASVDLRELLANLYAEAQEPEKAEAEFRELIKLRPLELAHRYQLAQFLFRTHNLDGAQRVLEDAVKARPDNDDAKLALVDFIVAQRSRVQGEKTLRDFIAREPNNDDLRLGLGALLQRTGAQKEALDTYADIVKRNGTGVKGLIARDRIAAIQFAHGNYAATQAMVDEVIKVNAHDDDAVTVRSALELQRHDAAAAVADLRAVLHDYPESVAIRRALARAYLANSEPALAEEVLRAGMDASTDPMLRVDLAQILTQAKRYEPAVALLEQTVQQSPNHVQARVQLARVYLASGNFAAARTAAQNVKALRPDLAAGPYLAALALQGEHRNDEAANEFEQALKLQPNAMDALNGLVALELLRGHTDKAIALVQSAIAHDPKSAMRLNLLGELYLNAAHDYARAAENFSSAIALDPHWGTPYRNLGIAKLRANDVTGGIAAYEQGVKAAPEDEQLITELAMLYAKYGRVDDAIAVYDQAYKRNPQLQFAANNLAMLLVTYKKDQRSLDWARDLSAGFASSQNGDLLDTNGWVRFKRGEYTDALPVLERAVERAPDSRVIRYHAGMAEWRVGQRERAMGNLEFALSGSANFDGSDEARSVLATLRGHAG